MMTKTDCSQVIMCDLPIVLYMTISASYAKHTNRLVNDRLSSPSFCVLMTTSSGENSTTPIRDNTREFTDARHLIMGLAA